MRIVFPEYHHPFIQAAIKQSTIEAIPAASLEAACAILKTHQADAMIAGIDHSTRDVILACRDHLGATAQTFSASVYCVKDNAAPYLLADCAACKNPTAEQLFDICVQTFMTASKLFDTPRLALLSFSTQNSGGHDNSITKIQSVVDRLHNEHPEILVDGELQLDCAVNPQIGTKKAPESPVAGRANVLICPDLNSGNILYKSLEHFGHYTAAGPILQGFAAPVSDLSRGSSPDDIVLTIETLRRLCE